MAKLTPQSQDFPAWYQEIVQLADLAEHSLVKGCMVIKPYGYAIWELIQKELDQRIKAAGVQNAYFPLFIPQSLLTREAEHVEGFAPECATVTHAGGKELAEPLVIRPTSETIIYDTYSKWVQSYRDLPLLINQWANVVRWEMRTRPFLRTTEFLWQEGHTVHATKEDAAAETLRALRMYEEFDRTVMALPVMTGRKSAKETFAGADYTLSTEALARDGKAIQAGTSHLLGQTFAKAFNIQFQDENSQMQYAWQTSWGVSTRLVGTLIVCHGDDKGLRLPPRLAPYQVVLIPILKGDDSAALLDKLQSIKTGLEARGVRVFLDARDKTPGWKFNEWEVKGAPVRLELGPRDLAEGQVVLARRDTSEKWSTAIDGLEDAIPALLEEIQANMLKDAEDFLAENTREASTVTELIHLLDDKGGFIRAPWGGDADDERRLQEQSKATIRIISEDPCEGQSCIFTEKPAREWVYFARSY